MAHYYCRTCGLVCSAQFACWNPQCSERGEMLTGCECNAAEHANPEPLPTLTAKEMFSLKTDLARHVNIAGMNPQQFEHFKRIDSDKWKLIAKDYDQYIAETSVFGKWSGWILLAIAIAAFAGSLYIPGWVRVALILIALWSVQAVSKREGRREGYFEGYEEGREAGIHEALGISEGDARFYGEAARDIEIGHRVLNKQP